MQRVCVSVVSYVRETVFVLTSSASPSTTISPSFFSCHVHSHTREQHDQRWPTPAPCIAPGHSSIILERICDASSSYCDAHSRCDACTQVVCAETMCVSVVSYIRKTYLPIVDRQFGGTVDLQLPSGIDTKICADSKTHAHQLDACTPIGANGRMSGETWTSGHCTQSVALEMGLNAT